MDDLAILSGRVRKDGRWTDTNLYVSDGVISKITEETLPARRTLDAQGCHIIPGIIDPHVHFELDLGRFKSVDDFASGPRAAAYGGVSAFIDFLDPVRDADALVDAYGRRLKAARKSALDYTFHATICSPRGNLESFVKTMLGLGMRTLKLFTTYSESDRRTDDESIVELLKLSERYGFLILAHIENDDAITLDERHSTRDLPLSRPTEAETSEALKLAGFVEETGGRMYMVHLSSGDTLEALKARHADLLHRRFFIETCPQYMTFTNDVLATAEGHLYTCAPPLRSRAERDKLVSMHRDIDTVGTDHCAFMRSDKEGARLKDIPLGFGSIEHAFARMFDLMGEDAIEKMTSKVADILFLPQKGRIEPGKDADLTIYLEEEGVITENHAASDYSVYHGMKRSVRVLSTMSRGRFIIDNGTYLASRGRLIKERT